MEIMDLEREKEYNYQLDTILILVCFACFWRQAEMIGPAGRAVR